MGNSLFGFFLGNKPGQFLRSQGDATRFLRKLRVDQQANFTNFENKETRNITLATRVPANGNGNAPMWSSMARLIFF